MPHVAEHPDAGYCHAEVSEPPHYIHRHQCHFKSKYRMIHTKTGKHLKVCGVHLRSFWGHAVTMQEGYFPVRDSDGEFLT